MQHVVPQTNCIGWPERVRISVSLPKTIHMDIGELMADCGRLEHRMHWNHPNDVPGARALDMQPGDISEPIFEDGHVFILKLEQIRRKKDQSIEEVKDILEEELRTQKRKRLEIAADTKGSEK